MLLYIPTLLVQTRGSDTGFVYDSEPLYLLTTASILSSAVSRGRLEDHKNSGWTEHNLNYKRLLAVFIITNAIAALCHVCGAIVIYCTTLADSKIDTIFCQGIVLVCRDHL
jgi:hypothetical protein